MKLNPQYEVPGLNSRDVLPKSRKLLQIQAYCLLNLSVNSSLLAFENNFSPIRLILKGNVYLELETKICVNMSHPKPSFGL